MADREPLASWLTRFDTSTPVEFALEGCTGWRYVVEEMHKAGVHPHLAEPADTAALRGPKRRAKTDKDLREFLDAGRLPECYIPPEPVLEWRATLEAGVVRASRARLMRVVEEQLSLAGRLQVNTALSVMDTLDEHLARLRQGIVATARHVKGAHALMDAIYGVGPMASLALVCWLGGADRFSSSRKAVRFVGPDITVRSSDSKRSPLA